jgi:outer membrane protein assembly factor BamD
LLLLCFFSSCIPKLPEDFTSEESLYDYTTQLLKEDKQDEALKFLSAFRNRYPLSQRTPEVELAIGDLHVKRAEYVEAIDIFQQFIELHPTHARINYALMQSAIAHQEQIPSTIDRDQTHIHQALEKFRAVESDPQFTAAVKIRITELQHKLADRDRYVANYYLKHKQWKAAEGRLLGLLKDYQFPEYREQALYDLIRVNAKLGNVDEQLRHFQELKNSAPDSKYIPQAQAILNQ